MIKKELTNKKVVRAIALGLSAVMLTTPMTALASDGTLTDEGNNDDNTLLMNEEEQSEVKIAASAANEAIDVAIIPAGTVKSDVETNVIPGEAGKDSNDDDLAQAVIDAADDVEDTTSEEGASIADADKDVALADAQIDIAESNADLAAGAVVQAGNEADDVDTIVTEAKEIADKAVEDVNAQTENIKNATTIADANAAYDAAEAVVEQAKTDFEAKKAEYETAKAEYEAAVAKVAEYEKAYNDAVAAAAGNAEDAAAELDAAKTAAAELESKVTVAKEAVDASAAGAMRIATAEKDTQDDGSLNWRNEDVLFKAIMEEYYLPRAGYKNAEVVDEKIYSGSKHNYNYFTVEYENENGETVKAYFNYKLGESNSAEAEMQIFVKREVEIFGGEFDQYVDADGNVKDIEAGLNDGSLVAIIDGDGNTTYYETNEGTSQTIIESSTITSTSTTDVTVSEQTTETYKIDETTGKLVKEVTADVTTVTYTGKSFTSDVDYATDAERDAAAEAKKAELNIAEGKEVEVVETQDTTTTYVATGTYIPTFTETVTVNQEIESGEWVDVFDTIDSQSEAKEYVYDQKLGQYYNEEEYYIIEDSNNLSVSMTAEERENIYLFGYKVGERVTDDSDYLVSGTASVTYAKVTKKSVNKDTFGAIWDDITSWFGGASANEKIEKAVKEAIEAAGGIFVKADWADWDWNKATVYYVEGVAVEGSEKDTAANAESNLNSVAQAQAKKNGADGVYNVKSETEKIDTTTYSYEINYYEETSTETESKVVATETYANAETLEGQIIQNLNYINKNFVFNQIGNEDYRAFVDNAKNLTAKYERLLKEAMAADDAVEAAQAKVDALQDAIADMEGKVNNEKALAELAGQLADAEGVLTEAQKNYDSLQDLMKEAADALEKVVDALTPDPVVGGEDDGDDDTTPTTPVVNPVVTPEEIPAEVVNPVAGGAGAGADVAVVDIEDEETPLAAGIDNANDDANDGEDDDVLVAGAEDDGDGTSLVAIEDEETPLAAGSGADGKMSWWWLLIVALLGATGYKMYKDHQKKKEEAAQEA